MAIGSNEMSCNKDSYQRLVVVLDAKVTSENVDTNVTVSYSKFRTPRESTERGYEILKVVKGL